MGVKQKSISFFLKSFVPIFGIDFDLFEIL
jgi:hypothetical protein